MIDPRLSKLKQLITGWDSDLFHGDFYFLLHYSAGYNSKLHPPPPNNNAKSIVKNF